MRQSQKSICTSGFITTTQCSQQQRLALCGVTMTLLIIPMIPHCSPQGPTGAGRSRTTVVLAASKGKPAKTVVIAGIASITATSSIDPRSSDCIVEERLIAARKRFLSSKTKFTDAVGTFFVVTGPPTDKYRLVLSER